MQIEEAILQLKDLKKDRESFIDNDNVDNIFKKDAEAIEVVLNELECMKLSQDACCTVLNCGALTNYIKLLKDLDKRIPKYKIKDKIEDLKAFIYTGKNAPQDFLQYRVKAKIQVLEELLEEE